MWTEEDAAKAAADGWQVKMKSIVPLGNKFRSHGGALQHVRDQCHIHHNDVACRALSHVTGLRRKEQQHDLR